MNFHERSSCLFVLLLFVCVSARVSINGSIPGIVTDPSSAVVVGAQVAAVETQTGARTETVTDSKGYFSFPTLPIGTYEVEVRFKGFRTYGVPQDSPET